MVRLGEKFGKALGKSKENTQFCVEKYDVFLRLVDNNKNCLQEFNRQKDRFSSRKKGY